MSETTTTRVVAAVIFSTAATVAMTAKNSFGDPLDYGAIASLALVVLVVLLAFVGLPLRNRVEQGVLVFTGALGLVSLVVWFAVQNPRPGFFSEMLILMAGAVLVWRSVTCQRANETAHESQSMTPIRARVRVIGVIGAVAAGSFLYHWLVWRRLEQTSALFIGIPALLAILATFIPRPKSATGTICMVTAIALLASGMFLGEGFICILMASPLFLLVAVIVGAMTDWARKRDKRSQTTMSCLLLLAFVPMSFEGTRSALSFPREEVVQREVLIQGAPEQIAEHFAATPHFPAELPAFLRLGFPRPVATSGNGLHVGDRRTIHFAGGEGKPGDLVMEVLSADANSVEFREVSDTSHVAHWLQWESTRFEWTPLSGGKTRVTCTVRYRRLLDPAWYFKPWERYAVGLSADYLLHSIADSQKTAAR